METLKLIIGTLSGFSIAFFAEPIKIYITGKIRKKQYRARLYRELIQLYKELSDFLGLIKEQKVDITKLKMNFSTANIPCYEFVKKDPILFYELRDSITIGKLYGNYQKLISVVTEKESLSFLETILSVFKDSVKKNDLDSNLLIGESNLSCKVFIQNIINS